MHAVSGEHTVSSVVDDGFVAYAVDAHVVFSVQLRSECVPLAVLTYSVDEHTVKAEQALSEVGVMLVEMY